MSVPVVPAMTAMATLSPIDSILQIFNTNPYFIGITMLLMNLGGRFLTLDVTKKHTLLKVKLLTQIFTK